MWSLFRSYANFEFLKNDNFLIYFLIWNIQVQWSLKFDVNELQSQPRLISLDILLDTAELCCIFDSGQILTINPDLKEVFFFILNKLFFIL